MVNKILENIKIDLKQSFYSIYAIKSLGGLVVFCSIGSLLQLVWAAFAGLNLIYNRVIISIRKNSNFVVNIFSFFKNTNLNQNKLGETYISSNIPKEENYLLNYLEEIELKMKEIHNINLKKARPELIREYNQILKQKKVNLTLTKIENEVNENVEKLSVHLEELNSQISQFTSEKKSPTLFQKFKERLF